MAVLSGLLAVSPIYSDSSGFNDLALDFRSRVATDGYLGAITDGTNGVLGNNQPVIGMSRPFEGFAGDQFVADYYFRTHITPTEVVVGNLLSEQTREIEVWNAHFVDNELLTINELATDGLLLADVPAPPLVYGPLESRIYTLTISTQGPAIIDGLFTFDFELDDYDPRLHVTGLRILAWWVEPNWSSKFTERWEWLTNIMTSKNDKEQRVKLRGKPRRKFQFSSIIKNHTERRLIENLLFAWQSRVFGVPVWTDVEFLNTSLVAGAMYVPCNTATRDYVPGGLVALLQGFNFEIATIDEVLSDRVTLTSPLASDWSSDTKVAPMRTARMNASQTVVRRTDSVLTLNTNFALDTEDDTIPLVETSMYRDYAVMEVRPNWREEIDTDYQRNIALLDFATGKVIADDLSGVPSMLHKYHWQAKNRAAIGALRAFLFARYGKLVPLWVPTFLKDFVVVGDIAPTSSLLIVENTAYARNIYQTVQRRDVRIELYSGEIIYRRIVTSTETGATEELILDSQVGLFIAADNIRSVSFMSLCRLEADSIEAVWETTTVMEVSAAIRSIRDDVQ
jgi:hypothetical protein